MTTRIQIALTQLRRKIAEGEHAIDAMSAARTTPSAHADGRAAGLGGLFGATATDAIEAAAATLRALHEAAEFGHANGKPVREARLRKRGRHRTQP